MDVMKIDLSEAGIAAFASTEDDGRDRWTELSVWYLPGHAKCWIAQAEGCTAVEGERTKRRRLASARLERALTLFDDSDIGVIAKAMAREYAEDRQIPVAPRDFWPVDDRLMLARLLGVQPDDLSINAAGKALGIGESKIRMALKDGRDIHVPLRNLLPFLDRAAFIRENSNG